MNFIRRVLGCDYQTRVYEKLLSNACKIEPLESYKSLQNIKSYKWNKKDRQVPQLSNSILSKLSKTHSLEIVEILLHYLYHFDSSRVSGVLSHVNCDYILFKSNDVLFYLTNEMTRHDPSNYVFVFDINAIKSNIINSGPELDRLQFHKIGIDCLIFTGGIFLALAAAFYVSKNINT